MSQKSDILAALKNGEEMTPLPALKRFGCMRLAARIGELKEDGWPIVPRDVKLPSGKTVAGYRLDTTGQLSLEV